MLSRLLLPFLGSLVLFGTANAQDDGTPQDGITEEVVRFNFRFGFFEDDLTPLSEVIKEDVEGVLCQTQYFLSQLVQNATNSKSVHAKATEIDWGYYEKEDLPAHINFTVEFTDASIDGDVTWVDDRILIDEMEALGEPGLKQFITNWVWNAEPANVNFFLNANRMAFDGVKQAPVKGQLEEAECPETEAPTLAPTVSPQPTTATTAPTMAPNVTDAPEAAGDPDAPGNSPSAAPGDSSNPNSGPGDSPNATDPSTPPPGSSPGDMGSLGNSPDATGGDFTSASPSWPFGENYDTMADLKEMADFSLAFSMFEDHEQLPTIADVNALMCEVNAFFTETLRRKLLDGTIHMKAVFIDYFFDAGGTGSAKEDIRVNFTAFAYYGEDEHDQVAVQDVFEAMKLTDDELKNMVEQYVWKSEPEQENLFFHTESLALDADVGLEPETQAMLIEADGCVLPPNGDGSPFAGVPGPDAVPGDPNQGLGGNATKTRIAVNFRVSNLENIKEANAVKASGLDASFPVFTNEMVGELSKRDSASRRVLRGGRLLRVVPVPGTATVDEVEEYPCPSSALPGLTCHSARARYDVLMSSDEDENRVQNDYTDASEIAVNDGTYNNALQRVDPDTPLYIGIMTSTDQIPPGSQKRGYDGEPEDDDDGWFKWWYILLLLLLLLLCCLCCLYCMTGGRKKETDTVKEETVVEEREVLVEEFEDEDVPPKDDEEGDFVDDPDAGAMVPYDPNSAPQNPPVAETGVPVSNDSQRSHDDQAERDRILSGSQREEKDGQVWQEDNQ